MSYFPDIGQGAIMSLNPLLFKTQAYIDGKWVNADKGGVIEVTNPATGEVIGTIPNMGKAEA